MREALGCGCGCAVDALVVCSALLLETIRRLHVRHCTQGFGMGGGNGFSTPFTLSGGPLESQFSCQVGPAVVEAGKGLAVRCHCGPNVGMTWLLDADIYSYAPLAP